MATIRFDSPDMRALAPEFLGQDITNRYQSINLFLHESGFEVQFTYQGCQPVGRQVRTLGFDGRRVRVLQKKVERHHQFFGAMNFECAPDLWKLDSGKKNTSRRFVLGVEAKGQPSRLQS
jgi:hypothetical protein